MSETKDEPKAEDPKKDETPARSHTVPLRRLLLNPGYVLVAVDAREPWRGRKIGIVHPRHGGDAFRLDQGESILCPARGTHIDISAEDREEIGLEDQDVVILPTSALCGSVHPEHKPATS